MTGVAVPLLGADAGTMTATTSAAATRASIDAATPPRGLARTRERHVPRVAGFSISGVQLRRRSRIDEELVHVEQPLALLSRQLRADQFVEARSCHFSFQYFRKPSERTSGPRLHRAERLAEVSRHLALGQPAPVGELDHLRSFVVNSSSARWTRQAVYACSACSSGPLSGDASSGSSEVVSTRPFRRIRSTIALRATV